MSDYICNAVITSADISNGERGFLDCWINLDYGGSGQGYGGFTLYLPKSFSHHKTESLAGHFIYRVMEIAGVTEWDKLKGKTIRVKKVDEWGAILALGHIVKNDWFSAADDFKAWREMQKEAK